MYQFEQTPFFKYVILTCQCIYWLNFHDEVILPYFHYQVHKRFSVVYKRSIM